MSEMLIGYVEDLRDNLIVFNEALMELEKGIPDKETINKLFRVAHTIKGNSAALEFLKIESVMHSMEDILHEVRREERDLTQDIVTVLYKCHDLLEDFMGILQEKQDDKSLEVGNLLDQLIAIKQKHQLVDIPEVQQVLSIKETSLFECIPSELWSIISENIKMGMNALLINVKFSKECLMRTIRVWMTFQTVDQYSVLLFSQPERIMEDEIINSKLELKSDSLKMVVLCENDGTELINQLNKEIDVEEVAFTLLTQDLISSYIKKLESKEVEKTIDHKEEIVDKNVVYSAHVKSEHNINDKKSSSSASIDGGLIRIPVNKVDNLMDMLGELLILNSQLEQQIESSMHRNPEVLNTLSRATKVIRSVQDLSMSLRLIEIKNTLHRLTRIARDTASELNKKVVVSLIGEETEIDRSAAEKLFDPLMHLVRNAVSHGIETAEVRESLGKNPEGKLEIKAYSKRGHVYIEVSDDGNGIDPDKILKKAIKLGMASETTVYSEEEILKFIFKPGFSTQEQVNNISGRGVGMNVVEAELKKMAGKIDIINRKGQGCSFVLRIPMNLALVNGTIVQIENERYIIPTLYIKEFLIMNEDDWLSMQGHKRALRLRDKVVPLITGEKIFGFPPDVSVKKREIIVLEMEQKLLALPVDKILGRQEIVSKSLGSEFSVLDFVSGVSILGDGRVSLILDIETLFRTAGI